MKARWCFAPVSAVFSLLCIPHLLAKPSNIEESTNKKDFEKTLRTRNNILTLFKKSPKDVPATLLKTLESAADQLKGTTLIVSVDCSTAEGRKICKKEKADPAAYLLKHYLKGQLNKDYDRPETLKSLVNFLKDPTAESPWEEDPTSKDVLHVEDSAQLRKFLTEEKKPALVMFYAPWCGHCKMLKPAYSLAASELKKDAVLAAMDVNKPHNNDVKQAFNISGFPTLYYFREGHFMYPFSGGRTKEGIVAWMRNPKPPGPDTDEGPKDVNKEEL